MKLSLTTPQNLVPTTTQVSVVAIKVDVDNGDLHITYSSNDSALIKRRVIASLTAGQKDTLRQIVKTAIETDLATTTTDQGV